MGVKAGVEAVDGGDAPLLLVATTLNVYVFPGLRPVIFAALIWIGEYVPLISSGVEVTR